MINVRRRHTAMFKKQVALEAIRERMTVAQIGAKYGVNPTLVMRWKREVLDGIDKIFAMPGQKRPIDKELPESIIKDLRAKIGELTMERDFFLKASKRLGLEVKGIL